MFSESPSPVPKKHAKKRVVREEIQDDATSETLSDSDLAPPPPKSVKVTAGSSTKKKVSKAENKEEDLLVHLASYQNGNMYAYIHVLAAPSLTVPII